MYFDDELKEAIQAKVTAAQRYKKGAASYLSVWADNIRIDFFQSAHEGDLNVWAYSSNADEKAIPLTEDGIFLGRHPRHIARKLIRILGACSPRYMSYALRHAGILEHDECPVCGHHHAPAALHEHGGETCL